MADSGAAGAPEGEPGFWRRRARSFDDCCVSSDCGDGLQCCSDGSSCCDLLDVFTLLLTSLLLVRTRGGRRLPPVPPTPAGASRAARLLLRPVLVYRSRISPRRPPCCRLTPTCSTYAVQALTRHGALHGSLLVVRRLRRCRPGAGGLDPVPV